MNFLTILLPFITASTNINTNINTHIKFLPAWTKDVRPSPTLLKRDKTIRVMIIDTGVDLHPQIKPFVEMTGDPNDYIDTHGHGTHMAGIVLHGDMNNDQDEPVCDNVKIISCKYYYQSTENTDWVVDCFKKAAIKKVDYVLFSSSGSRKIVSEFNSIRALQYLNITVVAAVGNNQKDLTKEGSYPASYGLDGMLHNIIPVMNICYDGTLHPKTNYHPAAVRHFGCNIKSTAIGGKYMFSEGSSASAAMYMHKILKNECLRIK